jgi:hypothetical protein
MQDSPTANELIHAVAQFLNTELAPTLNDPRLKFRALVAANVLQIVSREMELGDELLRAEWHRLDALMGDDPSTTLGASAPGENLREEIDVMTRALCVRIRAGEADGGEFHRAVFEHVEQTVKEKLQIANPRFLARWEKAA